MTAKKKAAPAKTKKSAATTNTAKKRQPVSSVEQYYLEQSGKEFIYKPTEKIPIVQVDNFPELGKLTALRFIEWVQQNPNGVVSLPTGKTTEHFIRWVGHIVKNWGKSDVDEMVKRVGIDPSIRPEMDKLHFVQIDEFYPIDSFQHNSFYYYIQKYYFRNLGLNKDRAMFMNINEIPTAEGLSLKTIFPDNVVDLSLRTRYASSRQERLQKDTIEIVDQFCTDYEQTIRAMGGIGFFLGGIGPDGHIGFNVQGSDHYSTTRLIATNYETQAAAATDLGGIEVARDRRVITIGLDTITYDPEGVAIIIAAGEAKSLIVRDSIESEMTNKYPASVLQKLENARFYLTNGAALRLMERRYVDVEKEEAISQVSMERAVVNLAVEKEKTFNELTNDDYKNDKMCGLVLKKTGKKADEINSLIRENIINRFQYGMKTPENSVFLHTAPHHDDIMLGYMPHINHLVRDPSNKHHFTYLTSGFTAVTNQYMLDLLEDLKFFMDSGVFEKRFKENYFAPDYIDGQNRDVNQYLDGIAAHSNTLKKEAVSRRLLRNIVNLYEEDNVTYLRDRVYELINYFKTQYPGKKDIPLVQRLKGMMREWEVEILWGYLGFNVDSISHLRLGFYQGEIFTENPEMNRDVLPVYELLKKVKPNVVTVALDPEGSGPDTHYKVLQAVTEALRLYERDTGNSDIKVWGYRNVWYRFHPAEANMYIPVSLSSFAQLDAAFMYSFGSQKNASFPSWEFDGPFSRLAHKVQADQYQIMSTCLGKDYFIHHDHARARAAKGMIFLKELTLQEFYEHSIELRKLTENY